MKKIVFCIAAMLTATSVLATVKSQEDVTAEVAVAAEKAKNISKKKPTLEEVEFLSNAIAGCTAWGLANGKGQTEINNCKMRYAMTYTSRRGGSKKVASTNRYTPLDEVRTACQAQLINAQAENKGVKSVNNFRTIDDGIEREGLQYIILEYNINWAEGYYIPRIGSYITAQSTCKFDESTSSVRFVNTHKVPN